ncbi:type II toxin-antitoxin system mRNA interferase toxin, RelE/StbE family [Pusillimonas sp. DMV24BSW_D]|uniref:type II toxin-antitoxin system mRNA interferase toxin, RelE/StbE family n=1 Tax=Neopusillimonas aestuarii TaxID=2716226 RepID=UPI00140CF84A|nr:type II toxin-antitoxin system mRNA interferase toxin, RelE/StbE family [Pusillimonas sp. DMV24BSW_D]QIM50301.1 type II toxin-antitoxin system mRNA interferase toxin, RelE/StbE family [Pusillimonas sp. DMV24BSW_D]
MTSKKSAASKRTTLPRANGDWAGYRKCHVGGDFLLIYRLDDTGKHGLVVFVRSGTHSELFS